jgi:hypothetical protein
MGDFIDYFKAFFTYMLVFTIILIIGGLVGYRNGYQAGIKDCNDKTILKQLGYE